MQLVIFISFFYFDQSDLSTSTQKQGDVPPSSHEGRRAGVNEMSQVRKRDPHTLSKRVNFGVPPSCSICCMHCSALLLDFEKWRSRIFGRGTRSDTLRIHMEESRRSRCLTFAGIVVVLSITLMAPHGTQQRGDACTLIASNSQVCGFSELRSPGSALVTMR